jgi:hypothetical protein
MNIPHEKAPRPPVVPPPTARKSAALRAVWNDTLSRPPGTLPRQAGEGNSSEERVITRNPQGRLDCHGPAALAMTKGAVIAENEAPRQSPHFVIARREAPRQSPHFVIARSEATWQSMRRSNFPGCHGGLRGHVDCHGPTALAMTRGGVIARSEATWQSSSYQTARSAADFSAVESGQASRSVSSPFYPAALRAGSNALDCHVASLLAMTKGGARASQ